MIRKSVHRPRGKVLVFGDDTRSFLATVRSLGRRGVEVHVAPYDFTTPALKSRYISSIHWIPYHLGDAAEWLQAVQNLLVAEGFELVIPCDERAMLPLHRHRDVLERLCRLALPDELTLDVFYDKHKTRQLAQSLDVHVAPGRLIAETDTAAGLIAEAGLPLVIKPRFSYTPSDLYSRGKVIIVNDERLLTDTLTSTRGGTHLFEAFVKGHGVGVSVLANRGKVLQTFEHHRVHEMDGSGYYRVSAALTDPLVNAVNRIVAALGYTGIAMFEFKVDRQTSNWILLEVNARPWGSLPLPVGLKIDFPYNWYRLIVEGVEPPARSYRIGVYCRNLVPDVRQTFATANDFRGMPWRMAGFLLRRLAEYARLLTGREFHDVLVRDDPRPGLSEIAGVARDVWERIAAWFPGAADRARRRDRMRLRNALRSSKTGPFTIVFVCQGNICRSPFAAAVLGRRLKAHRQAMRIESGNILSRIRTASAGMLPRSGVASPVEAVEAARLTGIDLGSHQSTHLSRDIAEGASVIVIFDKINQRRVHQRYPTLSPPTVFLGSFVGSGNETAEIADPNGGDLAVFCRSYEMIEAAVTGFVSAIHDAANN